MCDQVSGHHKIFEIYFAQMLTSIVCPRKNGWERQADGSPT